MSGKLKKVSKKKHRKFAKFANHENEKWMGKPKTGLTKFESHKNNNKNKVK